MEGKDGGCCHVTPPSRRTCSRRGCGNPVKKPTAKYCSVQCCSVDPARHERLRAQARRVGRRNVLPMARQLRFEISTSNPEAQLELICAEREDVPRGMSRLAAV